MSIDRSDDGQAIDNPYLPAASASPHPCEDADTTVISQYLHHRIQEASAQFDITMHYVNEAVVAERERCASIVESRYAKAARVDAAAAEMHTEMIKLAADIRSGE